MPSAIRLFPVQTFRDENLAAVFARALNDWLAAEWLAKDPRLRGSVVLPIQSVERAVEEIERRAADKRFVQVLMLAMGEHPLGKSMYWPIYAAAERHGFAVGIHAGSSYHHALTGSGWPTYYLEDYAAQSLGFHTQLGSLICEGVFVKYPKLKVVLIESGVTWLPPYLWRLSKFWRGVRNEVPWIDRSPEEFVRDHVRLTIQPFDAPPVRGAHWANHGPAAVRRHAAVRHRFPALAVRRRRDAARRHLAWRCARKILIDNPLATYPRLGHLGGPHDARCPAGARPRSRCRRPHRHGRAEPPRRSSTATCTRRCAPSTTSSPTCRSAGGSIWRPTARGASSAVSYEPYPKSAPRACRRDAWPEDGGHRAPTSTLMRSQYLDAYSIEYGILGPLGLSGQGELNLEFSAALMLGHQRLAARCLHQARAAPARAAIVVPSENAAAAVAEIERCADDPAFAQVFMLTRTAEPLGNRRYWPIYAAAERTACRSACTCSAPAGMPIPATGWPSYYIEEGAGHSTSCQTVGDQPRHRGRVRALPALKVVMIEGGFAWLPALSWRLDKLFERMRSEVPHLKGGRRNTSASTSG